MALPADQRALLQLLCERGQSYEDIGALLGTSAEEAKAKARAALTEIGGADPDAEVGITDYLLGQADPIGRADAVRHIQSDPEAHALATRIEAGLREIAPSARLPKLPEPRGKTRRAAVPAADESPAPARTGAVEGRMGSASGSRQTRLIAAIAAGGVVLLVAILAIAGVFGSGDEEEPAPATAAGTTTGADGSTTANSPEGERVTRVALEPSGGSGVAGTVDFGIANGNQLYADVQLNGLDPQAPQDEAVFLWLMLGEAGGYPLSQPLEPDQNGRFSGRIAVPTAVAATVAGQARTVRISQSSIPDLAKAAQNAAEQQVPVVSFTGELLADGKIPEVQGEG